MRATRRSEILRQRLSPQRIELIELAGRLAAGRGAACCLVGGCVRDLLLGRPVRELDLVVEGDATALGGELAARLGGTARSPTRFGTAKLELPQRETIDLASARRETYPSPAALPVVEPAGIDEDLLRRDFTINALAIHVEPACFGKLRDPCGGVRDLRLGLIRVLHDRSFIDDPTRALRAVRFAHRLGFRLEQGTSRWMSEASRQGVLDLLSASRLRRELSLLLLEMPLRRAAELLAGSGLLSAIFPDAAASEEALARLGRLDALLDRTRPLAEGGEPRRLALFVSMLLAENRATDVQRLADRLDLRGGDRELAIGAVAEARGLALRLAPLLDSASGIYFALERSSAEEALAAAALSPEVEGAVVAHLNRLSRVRPTLGGDDLIRMGVPPGPAHGRILREILAARLDGIVKTPEEEAEMARRLAGDLEG